ncbi:relaxase/mobilization nuclease domain-containing protein [Eubacterium callanderi]|uniref:relaxase/mobilization nuclease domain-containing protein n=1 Tax=Eubacterium callanderi TaxID=53442 RepID=UPI002673F49E|nr:relaxase/mobilization nuclease domain-containing protein [Eubacterium callanderi]
MGVIKMIDRKGRQKPSEMKRLLYYITDLEKTVFEGVKYTHAWNCDTDPENAFQFMRMTQALFHHEEKEKLCVHMIQSFPFDQGVTPKKAYKMGIAQIDRLPEIFEGFEILMGTHCDTGVLHNHFVINRTNSITGKRWEQKNEDLRMIKQESIKICEENGIRLYWAHNKNENTLISTRTRGEYNHRIKGTSWKNEMEKTFEYILKKATNKWDFMLKMQDFGYQINWWDDKDYVTLVDPNQFRCRSTTLNKTWTRSFIEKTLNQNVETEMVKLTPKNEFGYKKALSKDQQQLKGIVQRILFQAISRDDFIKRMETEGYHVSWSDKRKNITLSKNGKTNRLFTLLKPEEWTKEKLLEQFEKNYERNTYGNITDSVNPENKISEDFFDFSNDLLRLNASFNRAIRVSGKYQDLLGNLYSLGYCMTKTEDSFLIRGKNDFQVPIEHLTRFNENDPWTPGKVLATIDRNALYRSQHRKRAQHESAAFSHSARIVRTVGHQIDDYQAQYFGEKLEGQALKELAIKLASTENMDWESINMEFESIREKRGLTW